MESRKALLLLLLLLFLDGRRPRVALSDSSACVGMDSPGSLRSFHFFYIYILWFGSGSIARTLLSAHLADMADTPTGKLNSYYTILVGNDEDRFLQAVSRSHTGPNVCLLSSIGLK